MTIKNRAEKYSVEHEVSLQELKEMLIDKGILEYDGCFGGYAINTRPMEREE